MLTIGLTGNISSGKSTVSSYLKNVGARIIDADQVSRDIVHPGAPALKEIAAYFGPGVLTPDGALDRKKLGALVFTNPEAMEVLNGITHPRIVEVIEEEKKSLAALAGNGPGMLVIDAPLLIETGLHKEVDEVWVVTIEPEEQIRRLMKRDNISEGEAKSRIDSQMTQQEKIKHAQVIIDNNGTPADAISQVRKRLDAYSSRI